MSITSIWNNPFYNTPPIPKWSWELDFKSYFVNTRDAQGNGYVINYSDTLAQAAVSCSWGARNGNLISVYYAGVESKLPGRSQPCGDLTIKFNENTNMDVTKVLEELYHAEITCDSYFYGREGYAFNKNFNKVDRTIRLLIHKPDYIMQIDPNAYDNVKAGANISDYAKAQKNVLSVIEYHNCIMYKLDPNELSYESEDEVISHTATFSYDFMTVGGSINENFVGINDTCEIHK